MAGINLQGETEQRLVTALQQGRQEALGLLYDAYAPIMMGVISRLVPDTEVAEQVLQETFVAIWTRIGVYNSSRGRLLIWGLAIARGIAREAEKNGRFTPIATEEGNSMPTATADTEKKASERRRQEDKQLHSLEPLEKEVLALIYLRGLSCPAAATALGITEEKLKETIKKAFIHLKAEKSA